MLEAFVSDICPNRLRYLWRSFQISLLFVLDIIKKCSSYDLVLQCLKDIYLADDYEILYSTIFCFVYYYKSLYNNILFSILLSMSRIYCTCLLLQSVLIFFLHNHSLAHRKLLRIHCKMKFSIVVMVSVRNLIVSL